MLLNFFDNRSTTLPPNLLTPKPKALRATSRGVIDTTFFLFELANIYA
jgi:hypothetical protein